MDELVYRGVEAIVALIEAQNFTRFAIFDQLYGTAREYAPVALQIGVPGRCPL